LDADNQVSKLRVQLGSQIGAPDMIPLNTSWINRANLAVWAILFDKAGWGANLRALAANG